MGDKITDRCSHDPKSYRENCILCVHSDNIQLKQRIEELELECRDYRTAADIAINDNKRLKDMIGED